MSCNDNGIIMQILDGLLVVLQLLVNSSLFHFGIPHEEALSFR